MTPGRIAGAHELALHRDQIVLDHGARKAQVSCRMDPIGRGSGVRRDLRRETGCPLEGEGQERVGGQGTAQIIEELGFES